MKHTQKCPQCEGTNIYTNEALPKRGERGLIPVTMWRSIYTSVYVCTDCGYFEEYLTQEELDKGSMIEKIKEHWKKC
jgi:predicted nucleic-acid-binding Zn-ribbon protein